MHKTLPTFLLAIIWLILIPAAHATIITVNNNVNSPGQYSKLEDALNVAFDGDTIMIAGSSTSYGSITIRKKLVLIGTGYQPRKDFIKVSTLGNIGLEGGKANGIKLIGLYITGTVTETFGTDIADMEFKRCFLGGNIVIDGSSNIVISNCLLNNPISFRKSTNVLLQNNIFLNGGTITAYDQSSNILIKNNLFCNGTAGSSIENALFSNNIFYYANTMANSSILFSSCRNSVFTNNIYFNQKENPLPIGEENNTGTGNILADPRFVRFDYKVGATPSIIFGDDFHLQPGSAAIGYGTDGKDAGIYGGAVPMDHPLSGEPSIPQIRSMTINNNVVPPGGSLQVNVKAQKGN